MADFTLTQTGAELQNLINKIAPTEEKVTQLEDKAESKFASVDSEIENLKKGEAYVMGESLVFRNYADAKIVGNTLTL